MSETATPEGVIVGAWNYVISGYGLTAVVFLAYAWSLRTRRKAATTETENDG